MAKAARKPESKPREQAPEGTHVARLLGITDVGHQPGYSFNGKTIESEWKYEFTYELVNTAMEDGRPFVVSEQVPNKNWEDKSTGRASKLVSRAKSLAGSEYQQAMENLNTLLSKPCMITVDYNEKGYARIQGPAAIGSVPFGMEAKELQNETYFFDMDEPDLDLWEKMPEFKQENIRRALNFDETELAKLLAEGDQY